MLRFHYIVCFAVVVANISNNANLWFAIHGALARIHERCAFNSRRKAIHINSPFIPHTILVEGKRMRDKKEENAAAQMAWQLFQKTGSISYYMLYYDIMRKK